MAVFTQITPNELASWLEPLKLGTLVEFKGIASGIENSNFFVTLNDNSKTTDYVLTIFEVLTPEQLPFYLQLMQHLADKNIPVPRPFADNQGQLFRPLAGKPAALVSKLSGQEAKEITPAHCASVGRTLAQLHHAGQDFAIHQPNLRGLDWWQQMENKVSDFLPDHIADLLRDEIAAQSAFAQTQTYKNLRMGVGHCDLFVDNVLFTSPDAPSFIDFYFAGVDRWLFDLAVTVNDWCIERTTGEFLPEHLNAMMDAYTAIIPLTDDDKTAWGMMLRAAALRFWISRLYDFYRTREAAMLTPKDPTHFERILKSRRAQFATFISESH
ncbi:homoserine kinase [Hydromonas duriensis]|uniref:Homoserine kinase n=1 Tax=Hydromonas duriensis TaxID=1527608 RepID=A0A4R6Y4P1_9BURK|nr:homoserine kinase [Hydromonas duriensis]TDR28817.1 homoserine kinase [Hydromonas duriensis]